MKKHKNTHRYSFALFLFTLVLAACVSQPAPAAIEAVSEETSVSLPTMTISSEASDSESTADEPLAVTDEEGITIIDSQVLEMNIAPIPIAGLSPEEIADLQYMREEEKLAHDVYLSLYELWGLNIFQNIARAEQTHTDAVKSLLERYGLRDPTLGNAPGVFTDAGLQALYDQLVLEGSGSLEGALQVGGAIEELDILDLESALARTDESDIRMVYENLMKGSRNHLRAFTSVFERQTGTAYQPQQLEQKTYLEIVETDIERGGKGP